MNHTFPALLSKPPSRRQAAAALVVLAAVFGAVVMQKSVVLSRPQGDLKVFCCAGWAVRHGGELLYRVRDDNGWHYHYPPTFAILMAPLADPPRRDLALSAASAAGAAASPGGCGALRAACALSASPASTGAPESAHIPYPATVAICYLLNLTCLIAALALLRGALRKGENAELQWHHGLLPLLLCAPAVGMTLVRGQVQLLLLVLVAGFLAGLVRGRRFAAGLSLAGAICLKIFPAYLLLVPLARRDGRCLAGVACGLALGLLVLPGVVLGPRATARLYADRARFVTNVFQARGDAPPGSEEMLDATATHSQSFQVVLHKTLNLGAAVVPPLPAPWVRLAHWLIAAALTLAALWPGRVQDEEGLALARRVALLTLLMVLVCPVCHLHYFTLALPLVAVLQVPRRLPGRGLVFAAFLAAVSLAMLPRLDRLSDVGLPMYAALALAALAWRTGWPREAKPISEAGGCTRLKFDVGLG